VRKVPTSGEKLQLLALLVVVLVLPVSLVVVVELNPAWPPMYSEPFWAWAAKVLSTSAVEKKNAS
jgi:hypothetical protein